MTNYLAITRSRGERVNVVSDRNVFRYLYSIFMFAVFLVIFAFAPLVLLFGSLVFHCLRSFVLRVRIFLHMVYLAFIVIFSRQFFV